MVYYGWVRILHYLLWGDEEVVLAQKVLDFLGPGVPVQEEDKKQVSFRVRLKWSDRFIKIFSKETSFILK